MVHDTLACLGHNLMKWQARHVAAQARAKENLEELLPSSGDAIDCEFAIGAEIVLSEIEVLWQQRQHASSPWWKAGRNEGLNV